MSELKRQQLDFWTKFQEYLFEQDSVTPWRDPGEQNFYRIKFKTKAHINLRIQTNKKNLIGCGIFIDDNKDLFKFLESKKAMIENKIKTQEECSDWINNPNHNASSIMFYKEVSDVFGQDNAKNHYVWFYDKSRLHEKAFNNFFREFKNSGIGNTEGI